ncbi:hypothetical protein PVAP13_2KG574100 [Panicum virgatum]|uniref:Uncharacterized protein n=1 Tax=Panicum virgatum TaxID=38727 RepID=A0A8T0WHC4_PANVG|nr:hypothetical protein PVAP13_2KG574100 [Panicum virgatum]
MPGGGGGGGDDVLLRSSPAPAGGARQQGHPSSCFPLDVVAAIAARSDPATLTGYDDRLTMLDTAAADNTRFDRIRLPPAPDDDDVPLAGIEIAPLDSRGGLLLVRLTGRGGGELHRALRVCDLATDRSQALPSEPASDQWAPQNVHYVLLVGDGGAAANAVGRPFRVLKTNLVMTKRGNSLRRLQVQIFLSELGAWGPLDEIPTPTLQGRGSSRQAKPLVVGDVVHWLCLTHTGSYVLTLRHYSYLLATTSAGGNPVVLVADDERISAWAQSTHSKIWKQRPWVVIDKEAILSFDDGERLVERSARTTAQQSKKIVRRFPNARCERKKVLCSYEMCLSSWVPTFSRGTL